MSNPVDRNHRAGRGRPKGLFGSSFLRRHLRLEREAQIAAEPQPKRVGRPVGGRNAGSSTAFGSGGVALRQSTVTTLRQTSLPSSLSYLQQLVLMQAIEQSKICPSSTSGKSSESLGPSGSVSDLESLELLGNNPAEKILFQGRRNILSARAAKDDFTISDVRRVGSSVIEAAGGLWTGLLAYVQGLLDSGKWVGLMFALKRRYDETPMQLRVADPTDGANGPGSSKSVVGSSDSLVSSPTLPIEVPTSMTEPSKRARASRAAKIMQTEFHCSMLVQHVESKQCVQIGGKIPTWLQCLQTTKAQQISKCQQNVMDILKNLEEVSSSFQSRRQFVTTDRYSANLAAERDLQAKFSRNNPSKPFIFTHSTCNVHKVSGAGKSMSQILAGHVGGMVSVSLSMRSCGSLRELRQCLQTIFRESLVLKVGEPRGQKHRQAIYDLFLPVTSDSCTQVGQHASSNSVNNYAISSEKRRLILDYYLNGEIEKPEIVHYSTLPKDRETVLSEIQQILIPALLPAACPVLNRSKWLGCERSFQWIGILLTHHNLLHRLMKAWKGDAKVQAKPSDISEGPILGPQWSSWANIARPSDSADSRSVPVLDGDGVHKGEDLDESKYQYFGLDSDDDEFTADIFESQDLATGDIDWASLNKANIQKALAWLETKPAYILVTMSLAWSPILKLMRDTIYLGSEEWEKQQVAKTDSSEDRSYRVLELALGNHFNRFFQGIEKLFHEDSPALPPSARSCHMRNLMFRLLSRSGSAVHQLLAAGIKGSPYALFLSLWGILMPVQGLFPCELDELTKFFIERFPGEDLLCDEAQKMLSMAASLIDADITGIEVRHASLRRVNMLKSIQTWNMELQDLSADYVARQMVILRETISKLSSQPPSTTKRRRGRPQKVVSHKNPKRKKRVAGASLGGAWRAFLHENYHRTFLANSLAKEASLKYKQIKQQKGAEWEHYKNLGHLATLAGREGKKVLRAQQNLAQTQALVPAVPGSLRHLHQQIAALKAKAKKQAEDKEKQEETLLASQRDTSTELSQHFVRSCNLDSSRILPSFGFAFLDSGDQFDGQHHGESAGGLGQIKSFVASRGGTNAPAALDFVVPADHVARVCWQQRFI